MPRQKFTKWIENFEKINYHDQFENKVALKTFCEFYNNVEHLYTILNKFINIGWDLETVYYNDNKYLVIIDVENIKTITTKMLNDLNEILENCTSVQNFCKNKNKYFLQFFELLDIINNRMKNQKFITTKFQEFLKNQKIINEGVVAFHGSGSDFETFSNDFDATGIGAAGFGYGIYLTDNKQSAKSYAKSLEKTSKVFIDGVRQSKQIEEFLTRAVDLHGNKSDILLIVLKSNLDNLYKDNKITTDEYNFIKNSNNLKLTRSRIVYEVFVNGDNFISWNEPVTIEQINKIKKQAQIENINLKILIDDKIFINNRLIKNGENLYGAINMHPKETSEFLQRSGIDGIVYYEEGKNFVIFNPKNIKINKKINF
jgi:hypothetical protein